MMESELTFALRNVLSVFDLLTHEAQMQLIEELQKRAGTDPAREPPD